MAEAELVKKITLKLLAGVDRTKTKEETIAVMKGIAETKPEFAAIVGDMTGYGTTATQTGISTFLTGTFIALNRHTSKQYKASKAFLPKDFTDVVKSAFDARDKTNAGLHIHCIVSVVKDASSATGYTYVSEGIKTPATINREAELAAMLTSLPAPKQLTAPVNKKTS